MTFFEVGTFVFYVCLSVVCSVDRFHFGMAVVIQSSNGSLVDGVLRHMLQSDISSCINQCKHRLNCQYINYNRQFLQCFLIRNSVATETVKFAFRPGYVYGSKSDWILHTPCTNCGSLETCETSYTSVGHVCKINECGVPPEFPSTVMMGNMHIIGSKNAYMCSENKSMFIYTTHISECQSTGLWSQPEFACLDINECESSPCLHGGTCNDEMNHYTCTCGSGFSGVNCEIDINECGSNPCLNGGTCNDGANGYTCSCGGGWSGTHCEIDINECSSNPCLNDGTCDNGANRYTCSCSSGWSGINCEIDVDECLSNPCLHGGTCNNGVNGYTCTCKNDWSGTHCQTGQCDVGWKWYLTSCYKIVTNLKSYHNADCGQGHLAEVTSNAEMDSLKDLYLAYHAISDCDGLWLGPTDIDKEGTWRMLDGSYASYFNWAPGQPDGQVAGDDCIQVWTHTQFQWNDVLCSYAYWYYCEYELTT